MGIKRNRFKENDGVVESFFCGICKDVAFDAVIMNTCEHYLCRLCLPNNLRNCPTCASEIIDFHEMPLALKRIYLSIQVKCGNDLCDSMQTIGTCAAHEITCPKSLFVCTQECGFKTLLECNDQINQHNCIQFLKNNIRELRQENQQLKNNVGGLEPCNKPIQGAIKERQRVRCGIVFEPGEDFFRCFTCQTRKVTAICVTCFNHGDHKGHRFGKLKADAEGVHCDCGDTSNLDNGAPCSIHKLRERAGARTPMSLL